LEVLRECLLGIVLSENVQNLIPVETACEAEDALVFDVVEDGGGDVKSSSVIDVDVVFYL
jgi:hypothetical protein